MKTYEITFITKEDNREKPVKAILEALSGKITNISSLGQKTFAYPIKKEKSGFYTTVNFELEPEKVADLNKKLALEEEILRFLIVSAKIVEEAVRSKKPEAETVKVKEIIKAPVTEIEIAPVTEIVEVKEEKPSFAKATEDKPKKIAKPKEKSTSAKDTVDKPVKISKAVKDLTEEPVSEKERLDALDKKLEELLKE